MVRGRVLHCVAGSGTDQMTILVNNMGFIHKIIATEKAASGSIPFT